jgi:hypothetical protein
MSIFADSDRLNFTFTEISEFNTSVSSNIACRAYQHEQTTYTTDYYSPTNTQVIVLKTISKFYIKIALTCFGAVTPSSGSALSVLAKVTLCSSSSSCS